MTFAETYALSFPNLRPWSEAEIDGFRTDPFATLFGDEKGFLILRVVADEAEVITIAIHPDYRVQGRASHYLRQAVAHCRSLNVARIFLEVAADNHVAQMLYDGFGFVQNGNRKGYYHLQDGSRMDAILLEKQLSADS